MSISHLDTMLDGSNSTNCQREHDRQAAIVDNTFSELCGLCEIFCLSDTAQGSSSRLSQFHLFPSLPAELRLRIWEYVVPEPRTLRREWNNRKFQFSLLGPVPKLLHVCQETRYWFMYPDEAIHRVSANRYQMVRHKLSEGGGVFVNWARDGLFISRGFNVSDFEIAQLQQLRSLTMLWGQRPCWVKHSLFSGIQFVQRFPHLEKLTLRVKFLPRYVEDDPEGQKHVAKSENHELKTIASMVLAEFRQEKYRNPGWRRPSLRVIRNEL